MAKTTFEKQMQRLEEIVSLLEKEDTDLETSIALDEEGLKLNKTLQQQLSKFEEKIASLNGEKEESNDF